VQDVAAETTDLNAEPGQAVHVMSLVPEHVSVKKYPAGHESRHCVHALLPVLVLKNPVAQELQTGVVCSVHEPEISCPGPHMVVHSAHKLVDVLALNLPLEQGTQALLATFPVHVLSYSVPAPQLKLHVLHVRPSELYSPTMQGVQPVSALVVHAVVAEPGTQVRHAVHGAVPPPLNVPLPHAVHTLSLSPVGHKLVNPWPARQLTMLHDVQASLPTTFCLWRRGRQ
jgi:hypothetical protein